MALFKSDRLTSASGSVGGTTYSHNRYGMYTRARRIPVNPNTARQQAARNMFSTATADWRTLNDSQRAAWDVYAAATPVTNKLGDTVFLPGNAQFVAVNSLATQLGLATYLTAPVTPGRVPIGSPSIVIDASASTISLADITPDVAQGAELGVFLGNPLSAGVRFFKGPYQLVGHGPVADNPTLVLTAMKGRNGLSFVAGQKIPFRICGTTLSEGRPTTVYTGFVVVVA